MATIRNAFISTLFNTQNIVDAADVTFTPSAGQYRYNYNDGGGIDIDFDSVTTPVTGDEIVLSDDSTQFNYLMPAAEYAAVGEPV